jgi:hypothetical protein
VPTLRFGLLYCFFIIGHERRKILRFSVTRNPNALWIAQQMRESWPYAPAHKFVLFDRDSKFRSNVASCAKDLGSEPVRTAFRSPWQNGVAERWVGSSRPDVLNHVIVLNEKHLKRLMAQYVRYYHEDRTQLGWGRTRHQAGRGARTLRQPNAGYDRSLESAVSIFATLSSLRCCGVKHRFFPTSISGCEPTWAFCLSRLRILNREEECRRCGTFRWRRATHCTIFQVAESFDELQRGTGRPSRNLLLSCCLHAPLSRAEERVHRDDHIG